MASCLAEQQSELSDLLLDSTMTRTIDVVFRIVFACLRMLRVCICNGNLNRHMSDKDCDFYKCVGNVMGTGTKVVPDRLSGINHDGADA